MLVTRLSMLRRLALFSVIAFKKTLLSDVCEELTLEMREFTETG